MTDVPIEHRFYGDLAVWWSLISPVEEYTEEAAYAASVFSWASIPVRDVLELGRGGGHNAVHFKAGFVMTLVDLSPDMLAVSRRLNPECEHHQGDMRTVRLGRTFDAVFVHDAVDYMTSEADLRQAIETAFATPTARYRSCTRHTAWGCSVATFGSSFSPARASNRRLWPSRPPRTGRHVNCSSATVHARRRVETYRRLRQPRVSTATAPVPVPGQLIISSHCDHRLGRSSRAEHG